MVYTVLKPEVCYRCKTFKKLCGLPSCPIKERLKVVIKTFTKISTNSVVLGSTPPSGVVGEFNYPKVNIYTGISPDKDRDVKFLEDPQRWWLNNLSLDDVVKIRSSMISILDKNVDVHDVDKLLSREISLIQISSKPVDCDVFIEKILDKNMIFDLKLLPLSVRVLGNIKISSNPKIERSLEKVIYDTDLKARDAVIKLYRDGIDIYIIQKAFSFGLLGTRRFRKLVPTRWAITAVDRIISQYLRNTITKFEFLDKFKFYQITYMNNRFTVIMIPGSLKISWLEFWYPRLGIDSGVKKSPTLSVQIEEDLKGNVETMDGGFEAARMGILETLYRRRVQCRVIIVREILPEYYIGIGNWHIREDMRNIVNIKPILSTYNIDELIKTINEKLPKEIASVVVRNVRKLYSQKSILETLW